MKKIIGGIILIFVFGILFAITVCAAGLLTAVVSWVAAIILTSVICIAVGFLIG